MKRTMEVTLTDECLASWMAINNSGISHRVPEWDSSRDYWTGVQFRLGKYELIPSQIKHAKLYGVRMFLRSGGWVDIKKADFEANEAWINVVPCMEPNIRERIEPVDVLNTEDRKRFFPKKVHSCFDVLPGGITVWEDWRGADGGFDLEARMVANMGKHNRYAFTFVTEISLVGEGGNAARQASEYGFRVDVARKGSDEIETYPHWENGHLVREPVVAMMIAGPDDLPSHGDGQNPPQKP